MGARDSYFFPPPLHTPPSLLLTLSLSTPPFIPPCHFLPSLPLQLARDKKMLDEKLQETQSALEAEENKAKGEHRAKLKLESAVQEVEEKLDRETAVSRTMAESMQDLSRTKQFRIQENSWFWW